MELNKKQTYKIKLSSGRILGPLDLERIQLLILKNQIVGTEVAREYPQGDWQNINQIPKIAELLISKIEKDLGQSILDKPIDATQGLSFQTKTAVLPGATQVLTTNSWGSLPSLETNSQLDEQKVEGIGPNSEEDQDRTLVGSLEPLLEIIAQPEDQEQKTRISSESAEVVLDHVVLENNSDRDVFKQALGGANRQISQEKTIVFQGKPRGVDGTGAKKSKVREMVVGLILALVLGTLGYDLLLPEPESSQIVRMAPIRPQLPGYIQGRSDPAKSVQIYNEAMKFYVADTVQGYKIAADKLRLSASYDINNVKSLAMLASSYLNLIDSSNKDENYFSVISKLIEMSRAKAIDLAEAVVADVEFYIVVNKPEAAQNRLVEYTKSHQNYGPEMFYYLALTFFSRGDAGNGAKYLADIPDNKVYSSKIFYLRGMIAENLNDFDSAMREYQKAIKFNPSHVKSRLKLASLMSKNGKLSDAASHLEFILGHQNLISSKELGLAYYLYAQFEEIGKKWNLALGDVERAVKLDPDNHNYLLELYTLRAKAGESIQAAQKQARMYYYLGEGEKLIQLGKFQDALVPLLQARESNTESPLPLVKIGDMFNYLHNIENARVNYKLAAERAPKDIQVWSKYIESLIDTFEWEEASQAMDKFRKLPVSQSSIDKAAADMYQKQGYFIEAQTFYKKAMARDSIDPDVYIAYAKSLMSIKNFKDAPFFFALALRFDPLNIDAIINTSKCVAETESIDKAISMLQEELQKGAGARAEYLAAIAEFQIQRGDWQQAQQNIDQAMQVNPDYAYTWKLQAQIFMNQEQTDKGALDKAQLAFKSYSDRNPSDPSGYLERYKIFIKKADFEKAKEELNRIFAIYPKYPNLHFYLGTLYSVQGNHNIAAEEFKKELQNNSNNLQTVLSYGKELLEMNHPQDALTQFSKAMQILPTSSDAKQNAAWANYRLKNYQAAVMLMKTAITLDVANPTLYKRLGIIYRDTADLGNACGAFKKYLEMEPDAPDKNEYQSCF